MKRRNVWLNLGVGCLGVALAGCETIHRHGLRAKPADTPTAMPPLADDNEGAASHTPEAKGFFKPTRLPGALSSEAAEIERDLGVFQ